MLFVIIMDSRNRILMWHEFPYDYNLKEKIKYFLSRLKVMAKILLFETNKYAKLSAVLEVPIMAFVTKLNRSDYAVLCHNTTLQ